MPLKLSISLARKVGLPKYSSLAASCALEVELESALLSRDPIALGDRARRAYAACAEAVEDALLRHRPAEQQSCQDSGTVAVTNGSSAPCQAPLPATARQLEFMRHLATQLRLDDPGLEALVRQRCGKPPAALSRSEASQVIDLLRQCSAKRNDGDAPPDPQEEYQGIVPLQHADNGAVRDVANGLPGGI